MDRQRIDGVIEQAVGMASGAVVLGVLAVADRSGLLGHLAGCGRVTAHEAAAGAGLETRYVEEILATLAAGEVIAYYPADRTFEMSEETVACLVDERSPYFLGGYFDMLPAVFEVIPGVVTATVEGGGVPFGDFGAGMVRGIDRSTTPSANMLLTRKWLPAMPEVVAVLEAGGRIADVGCGSGSSALAMARAYPRSDIVGIDIDPRALARARDKALDRGLENVEFVRQGAGDLSPDPGFDLITSFDVIHDVADPLGVVLAIREALMPGGTYLMMEPRASSHLEENQTPRGALLYGISVLHCLTQSLAEGGPGLGNAWGPQKAEALCREAGFSQFVELPIENPFSSFYQVKV